MGTYLSDGSVLNVKDLGWRVAQVVGKKDSHQSKGEKDEIRKAFIVLIMSNVLLTN